MSDFFTEAGFRFLKSVQNLISKTRKTVSTACIIFKSRIIFKTAHSILFPNNRKHERSHVNSFRWTTGKKIRLKATKRIKKKLVPFLET